MLFNHFKIGSADFVHGIDEAMIEATHTTSPKSEIQDAFQPETDEV